MKKLFRITVAALLLLSLATLFANEPKGDTMDGVVELSMFAYQDMSDPVTAPNWEKLLTAFEASHPNIKLNIEVGFNEPYHDKLQAMTAGDQLPDVLFLWPGKRTGQVTGSGKIKDLRPFLAGRESDFSPMAVGDQGPNGELYELPEQVTATHVMYTNNKLLKQLGLTFPKTMEELIAQGDVIRGAGLTPIAMDNGDGWEMQSCFLSALVERMAGKAWFDKAVVGDASFNDAEFLAAVQVIKDLYDAEMFSPGINQASYGIALTDFVTEKAVYLIDGGWRVNNLVGELADEQKPDITLEVFPAIAGEKNPGATAAVAGTGYGMNAKLEGAKAQAAWEWIWFYSGPVGSIIRQGFGANPAYNLPVAGDADEMLKKLVDFLATTPAGYVIDAVMDGEGMGTLHPLLIEMMMGNKTVADVGAEYEEWVAANDTGRGN
jgi:raffinose/stachyose/melibiose transport system substrate-binding protein